jgi:hypothetical protein
VTDPPTLAPPGPINVNVEVVIVAGFIALLNVALIMAVLPQTPVVAGVTRMTEGVAIPFLSESPHPATKLSKRSTVIQILLLLWVRIHNLFFLA